MIFKVQHPEWGWLALLPNKRSGSSAQWTPLESSALSLNYIDLQSVKRAMRKHWPTETIRMSFYDLKEPRRPSVGGGDQTNHKLVRVTPKVNGEYVYKPERTGAEPTSSERGVQRVRVLRDLDVTSVRGVPNPQTGTIPRRFRVIDVDSGKVFDVEKDELFISIPARK